MSDLFVIQDAPHPLSKEEIIELFYKMHAGDFNARQKIIEHNIRLVLSTVIKNFYSTSWEMPELVSVGMIGLIKSVDTFDVSKGASFSVYALRCIENEIICFIKSCYKYKTECSLDSLIYKDDENDLKLESILYDESSNFVLDYENKEINRIIRQIVANFPERTRQIMEMYFGFNTDKPQGQRGIAKYLGMSKANVSRILAKTLKQISFILENEEIIEFNASNLPKISLKKRKRQ